MKRYINQIWVIFVLATVGSCGPKQEPEPALPGYLRLPATLTGYEGSGLITVEGALSLRAEGPETQDPATKTYTGVLGAINKGFTTNFTDGQPLPYKQSATVPAQYRSNGQLILINAIEAGTYPMGYQSQPTPTGAQADIILNLPGPQLYSARLGTITISESSLIKTEGIKKLFRLQGSFQAALFGTGVGAPSSKDYHVTGTFDLLLVD